jgi:hypothetical protein
MLLRVFNVNNEIRDNPESVRDNPDLMSVFTSSLHSDLRNMELIEGSTGPVGIKV